jgi:hypothetical protein
MNPATGGGLPLPRLANPVTGATINSCSAPISIEAVLTPPLPTQNQAPPITWTGGTAVENLHRTIPCVDGAV